MNFGLSDNDKIKIRAVFSSFPGLKEVWIYGSRAKGNFRPGSDIDLAIKRSQLNLSNLNQIREALEALHLPYTFDVCQFEDIQNAEFLDHIERIGVEFYRKE